MRRQKMTIDPDLGDLEEMLAHVQTQLEHEIDLEKESKMPSLTNIQESPKMVKRTSSFSRTDTYDYHNRRPAPRPPPVRSDSGSRSLNGFGEYRNGNGEEYKEEQQYSQPDITGSKFKGSQTSLKSDEGSQSSFQSFRSEPISRLSVMSLQEKRGSYASLNGRHSKTATLPRGYGSTKEKNWEEYWAW